MADILIPWRLRLPCQHKTQKKVLTISIPKPENSLENLIIMSRLLLHLKMNHMLLGEYLILKKKKKKKELYVSALKNTATLVAQSVEWLTLDFNSVTISGL